MRSSISLMFKNKKKNTHILGPSRLFSSGMAVFLSPPCFTSHSHHSCCLCGFTVFVGQPAGPPRSAASTETHSKNLPNNEQSRESSDEEDLFFFFFLLLLLGKTDNNSELVLTDRWWVKGKDQTELRRRPHSGRSQEKMNCIYIFIMYYCILQNIHFNISHICHKEENEKLDLTSLSVSITFKHSFPKNPN